MVSKFFGSKIVKVFVALNWVFWIFAYNTLFFGCVSGFQQYGGYCTYNTIATPLFIFIAELVFVPIALLLSPLAPLVLLYIFILIFGFFKSRITTSNESRLIIFALFMTFSLTGITGRIIKNIDNVSRYNPDLLLQMGFFLLMYLCLVLFFCFYYFKKNSTTSL